MTRPKAQRHSHIAYTGPVVWLVAATDIIEESACGWLQYLGVKAPREFLSNVRGSPGERIVELAGRNCYRSFGLGLNDNLTAVHQNSREFHANYMKHGHFSLLEHATGTFVFEHLSRICTHELVRHRIGVAYSQLSGRYVRSGNVKVMLPADMDLDTSDLNDIEALMVHTEALIRKLAEKWKIDEQPMAKKKAMTSALRRLAPGGSPTAVVATYNLRALRHVIALRTAVAAEEEIRRLFRKVFTISYQRWPYAFADAVVVKDADTDEPDRYSVVFKTQDEG